MSRTAPTVTLGGRFARELAETGAALAGRGGRRPAAAGAQRALAAELGLDPAWLRSPDGLRLLVGTAVPDGAAPVAQAYAGHQFGGLRPRGSATGGRCCSASSSTPTAGCATCT